jgi:hypothetical protein
MGIVNPRTRSVVTFRVRSGVFPATWTELRQRLGTRAGTRSTESHPIWGRIDGRGHTIWLSDVRLADSRSEPPVWEVRMEALAALPPEGQRHWEEVRASICEFFEQAGLPLETT